MNIILISYSILTAIKENKMLYKKYNENMRQFTKIATIKKKTNMHRISCQKNMQNKRHALLFKFYFMNHALIEGVKI